MGEPDSIATEEIVRQLVLGALGPSGKVSACSLREAGLHREFLQLHFQALRPEIKNLVGWSELREFKYVAHYREERREVLRQAVTLNERWAQALDEQGLSEEFAVLIFDGEQERAPAPDYRLFVLRDGRMLYYAGGFHGHRFDSLACGEVLDILNVLDRRYSGGATGSTPVRQPFLVIVQAMARVFERAIKDRERKIRTQKAHLDRLNYAIAQVSAT